MNDLDYLQLALDEAIAAGKAGEVPVGAVIVCKDAVLARAQNRVMRDKQPLNFFSLHCQITSTPHPCLRNFRMIRWSRLTLACNFGFQ